MVMEEHGIERSDYIIFLNEMESKLSAYYDVTRDFPLEEKTFDLYAEYRESLESTFIIPMFKIYAYHVFAHILVKKVDNLTKETVEESFEWLKTVGQKHLLKVVSDHYLTVISMVIVAPSIDEKSAAALRKTFLTRAISLRLKGSYDLALIGYDWNKNKVHYAKGAEEIAKSVFSEYFKN